MNILLTTRSAMEKKLLCFAPVNNFLILTCSNTFLQIYCSFYPHRVFRPPCPALARNLLVEKWQRYNFKSREANP